MSTIEPIDSVEEQRDDTTVADESKPKSFLKNNKLMMTLATILGVILIVLALSLAIIFSTGSKEYPERTFYTEHKIDCAPWMRGRSDADIQAECGKLTGCVYQKDAENKDVPSCYFSPDEVPFLIRVASANETDLGLSYDIIYRSVGDQTLATRAAGDTRRIKLEFEFLDDFALRFKISDPNENEYQVPIKINKPATRARNPRYEVKVYSTYFAIIRKSNQHVIWNNSLGPIIYEKYQKQITTVLPSKNVYGFGENRHESFRHDLNYQNWPMFARDEPPENVKYANLYGSQPFYTCMEEGGQSHGVVLVNSNAIDYEFTPYPALTYRVTGGILDFYIFLGPEPENVIQQFTQYFGRTFFPPYWALGFQVSRYGYKDLDDMKKVLQRFLDNDIPLDTQVADIDHYDKRKDFTIDPINWAGLPEYFDELHEKKMKTVMILDPALVVNEKDYWPYEEGLKNDVFIKWPKGMSPDFAETKSDIMLGWCWPEGKVAYPDYFKNSTQKWWIDSIVRHHKTLSFDGLWIDMNEPAVFGTNEKRPFNMPSNIPDWSLKCPDTPYEIIKTKSSYLYDSDTKVNKLSDKTLCMDGLQGQNNEYAHYDVHNLYGLTENIPTYEAAKQIVNGKRPFVITRSTFLGSGQYGGHWTGDNHSLWRHLYYSIIGMLEFNLFGIPYVGADICGFWQDATDELCARWSSLGAFYPFSRNHNNEKNKEQDPGAMGQDVINSAKNALNIRYEILPYYYTLFYRAHLYGNTVVRPLFHEYPSDENTYGVDKQFLVGPAFLVTPVIEEKKTTVEGYFPADRWYSYHTGEHQNNTSESGPIRALLDAPIDFIPLHIRGGHIIPTQEPARTTQLSSLNPFGIIVAPNEQGEARGDLFYDDGDTELDKNKYYYATFSLAENEIKMNIEHNTYDGMSQKLFNTVRLFVRGVPSNMRFYLNGVELGTNQIEIREHEIVLKDLNHDMSKDFRLVWTTDDLSRVNTLIDCSLQSNELNQADCIARGCQYDATIASPAPKCHVPSDKGGYKLAETDDPSSLELKKADDFSLFKKDVDTLRVEVNEGTLGTSATHKATRIKITDKSRSRYEVPIELNYKKVENPTNLGVAVRESDANGKAYMEVTTKDGSVLFDTKNIENAFVYDDQFIQIFFNLRDYKNAYGFGENSHYTFRHQFAYDNWWAVFGRDQPTGGKRVNHYGAHPFFMAVNEKNGRAFGMLIMNSNAQEYGFLPSATLAYRTMGGILDMYIIEAESPEAVIESYTQLIGTPFFPPYWSLGFQLCRYGYNSLDNLKAAVDRTLNAHIPLDIQYADIDHFDKRLDFTYDPVNFKGLPAYVDELRSQGIKFIIILDPAIDSEAKNYAPYQNGVKADVYIKWPEDNNPQLEESPFKNNTYMLGYVWPDGKTAFPDYFKNTTQKWWISEIVKYYKTLKFDGLWIDMNEPANFDTNKEKPWNWPEGKEPWNLHCPTTGPGSELEDPAYRPLVARLYDTSDFTARLSDKTICMMGLQGQNDEYKHYDVHNLYGHVQSFPTLDALREIHPGKRSIVISRSTFVSSGTAVGHWLGDNTSQWKQLKLNLIGLLEFNLFGIPYVGADTCGFFEDSTPELCTRWMQVGAFNTFFRNHNGFNGIDQDPAALGVDTAAASRKVVETRYTLLPYLYSLFYHVHVNGGTVVRSLVHEFPTDSRTLEIYQQFMWGSHLLISPVLDKNTREVYAYFPKARWYDYYSGQEVKETGRVHVVDAPLDHLPLHVRGGAIIVTQGSAMNTEQSRLNPFSLLIAMRNEKDEFKSQLYYDDGNTLDINNKSTIVDIKFKNEDKVSSISMEPIKTNYKTANLTSISIYGWNKVVKTWTLNGKNEALDHRVSYNHATKVLEIHGLDVDLRKKTDIKLTF